MRYKVYIQSLATEKIIVEANSQREAFELAAVHDNRTSNIIRFAMVDADGFVQQTLFPRFDWSSIRRSVPWNGTEQECIAHQFRLQLIKSLALTELIADLDTTRDLAVERNEFDCEVLMTRDFVDEYDAFMQVIRTARAALDLPDQKYAAADALSNEGGDDCDENHEEYPGPRLDGQYPSKFYERVPDWSAEAANITRPSLTSSQQPHWVFARADAQGHSAAFWTVAPLSLSLQYIQQQFDGIQLLCEIMPLFLSARPNPSPSPSDTHFIEQRL